MFICCGSKLVPHHHVQTRCCHISHPSSLVCHQVAFWELRKRDWFLSSHAFHECCAHQCLGMGFSFVMAPKVEWRWNVWFFGGESCLKTGKPVEFVKVHRGHFMKINRWFAHCFRGLANHNIVIYAYWLPFPIIILSPLRSSKPFYHRGEPQWWSPK